MKMIVISDEEYNKYRSEGLSGGFKATLFGDNTVKVEGASKGISRCSKTGKIKLKSSYTQGQTKRFFTR